MQITHAMILAAGLGKRMQPLTLTMPKPMVPVAGKPLIDYAIAFVQQYGIAQLVINTGYLADQLEAHLRAHHDPSIVISRETTLLETGGGIANALTHLGTGPFLSINSDTICIDPDRSLIPKMLACWQQGAMDICWALQPVQRTVGYHGAGDFVLGKNGKLRRRQENEQGDYVFTGVQILSSSIFDGAVIEPFSMNRIYDRYLDADGWFTGIGYVIHDGDWLHVGDPEGISLAEKYLGRR